MDRLHKAVQKVRRDLMSIDIDILSPEIYNDGEEEVFDLVLTKKLMHIIKKELIFKKDSI